MIFDPSTPVLLSIRVMLTLGVRSLATLALPHACPRCFWLVQKLAGDPPYVRFPSIFREIDAHAKTLVRSAIDRGASLPTWFPKLGDVRRYLPEEALDWKRFNCIDRGTGIRLRGVPDEVLQLADGSYHIVDYKTARITNTQDRLFPLYQAQLNAYALIADELGYAPVSGLSLLYLEPQAGTDAGLDDLTLTFAAVRRDVELRPDLIRSLLVRAKELLALRSAPAGRSGCDDCRQLERLMDLFDYEEPPF